MQQGEPDPADKKAKPKRASLPKGMDGEAITLDQAVGLLSLPRLVGLHPESGEPIEAGLGRFGPYVKMGAIYGSLDKDDDVLTIGLNRAVDALAKKLASIRSMGAHPKDGEPVMIRKGRFGPYAQHGNMVATLPRGTDMNEVTLDEAVALLAEKGKPLKAKAGAAKKKTTTKTAAKKTATKAEAEPKKATKKLRPRPRRPLKKQPPVKQPPKKARLKTGPRLRPKSQRHGRKRRTDPCRKDRGPQLCLTLRPSGLFWKQTAPLSLLRISCGPSACLHI